eukprot:TRINITY_DN1887_c0_g1_i1.p1 TRINITY_DN1887_c0_g1~~TRINITY_DN1887_c0_g1_i1.p1  ORF type:complete len:258 (-),score=35.11 TRINITY_DN1887_c0_g1_i1:146-919(-)
MSRTLIRDISFLAALFISLGSLFGFLVLSSPEIDCKLELPSVFSNEKVKELKDLHMCALKYMENAPVYTVTIYSSLYIFLQMFAIPGPIFLSILAGGLFGLWKGQLLIAFCATTGASLCYFLSWLFGRILVQKLAPGPLKEFQKKMDENKGNMFSYMLFLRLLPVLPNWLINVASPIVGMKFRYFFLGTLLGLVPANFIHTRTGLALQQLTDSDLSANIWNILLLLGLSMMALVPSVIKKWMEKKVHKDIQLQDKEE